MVAIASLWLPIVLAAVAVFIVSSILHMVLTYHRSDYRPLPDERETLAGLRRAAAAPGLYQFPHCGSPKEMGTPEMMAKFEEGPVGILTLMPNRPMGLGRFLGLWFGYCLLVSFFLAYVASRTVAPGTDYLQVFRVVGTVGFLAYGLSNVVDSIWKAYPWSVTCKHVFDGLLYALVSAGVFGWLWPAA
jgi:hypothetical protein